ncbi:hypothetical protein OPV22_021860 [Ensete ventricosum]|uniref:Uncharacterized protein n=1 Tax=Ensete ventricosum TaxID=4639 RepID=A0AAV8QNG8_ENSVE|nr:hypothetical protein OPV22_021860 [Ensete ventricosum]
MKATLKGQYEVNESASAVATFAIDADDFMNSIRLIENTVNHLHPAAEGQAGGPRWFNGLHCQRLLQAFLSTTSS